MAARTARLCAVAEQPWRRVGGEAPVYVIGTEVPVPGGAQEALTELALTEAKAAAATIDAHRSAFQAAGLHDVWPRVIGLVVQPGVEFDHHQVIEFQAPRAADLVAVVEAQPYHGLRSSFHRLSDAGQSARAGAAALCDTESRARR